MEGDVARRAARECLEGGSGGHLVSFQSSLGPAASFVPDAAMIALVKEEKGGVKHSYLSF